MASNTRHFPKNQFLCAICLDTFKRPVTTPCGHNYCLSCISLSWDNKTVCRCPICNETFQKRPNLKVNTFISTLVSQLVQVEDADTRDQCEEGGDFAVQCDICTDGQKQAVKSCLECLTSYCSKHLEPHHRAAGLKRHTLIDPVSDLPARMCTPHNRKVELFCLDDKEMLCDVCASSDHSTHYFAPLGEAHEVMKSLLGNTEDEVEQMFEELQARVRAEEELLMQRKQEAEDVITSSEQQFAAMVCDVRESQAMLVTLLKERQQAAEKEACLSIGILTREVEGLQRAQLKLSMIKQTEDQITFLQNCRALPCLPHKAELPRLSSAANMDPRHFQKSLSSCMSQLQTMMRKQTQDVRSLMLCEDQLRKLQQYEVSIVLDPDTAHRKLILSSDGKEVHFNTGHQRQSRVPRAFTLQLAVLGRTGFSAGKFYFEVFVGKKTEWCLGVATASVRRNQYSPRSPGCGIWALFFMMDRFESWSSPRVTVFSGRAERIGVFVDYDKGEMLFYDVGTPALIHSFTDCHFTEEIRPYFNPWTNIHRSNLDPMIIVPVQLLKCGEVPFES